MRSIALMAALILVSGCSQPNPSGGAAAGANSPVSAPAATVPSPSAGSNVAIIPTIDYPEPIGGAPSVPSGQGSSAGGGGSGGGSSGGSSGGGSSGGGGSTPAATAAPASPVPGPVGVTLRLNQTERVLAGEVLNLTAADSNRLIYHYGASPDALSARQEGEAVRISIVLPGKASRPFRQAEIEGVLVTYMRVEAGGSYQEWRGAFDKDTTTSTLSFDGSSVDGKVSFKAKGTLISDGSGGSWGGWGGGSTVASQMLIDWTMQDLPLAPPPSPAPSGSPTPSPTPSPGGFGNW